MKPIRWTIDDDAIVRTLTREDADTLYRVVDANRDRLRPFMPWELTTYSATDTLAFIERSLSAPDDLEGNGIWVSDSFAGSVGLRIDPLMNTGEMGYWVAREFEGRGLVSRCAGCSSTTGSASDICIASRSTPPPTTDGARRSPSAWVSRRKRRSGMGSADRTARMSTKWSSGSSSMSGRPRDVRSGRLRSVRDARPGVLQDRVLSTESRHGGNARRRPRSLRTGMERTSIARQTGGFVDIESNVRAICATLDVTFDEEALPIALDQRLDLYRTWFHPRRGALETLTEVKQRGYPIALISMCAPDAPAMWRSSALAPFVDVEVFSSEVGLRKPDPAIYLYATEVSE